MTVPSSYELHLAARRQRAALQGQLIVRAITAIRDRLRGVSAAVWGRLKAALRSPEAPDTRPVDRRHGLPVR